MQLKKMFNYTVYIHIQTITGTHLEKKKKKDHGVDTDQREPVQKFSLKCLLKKKKKFSAKSNQLQITCT